jgi:hypothetical protein
MTEGGWTYREFFDGQRADRMGQLTNALSAVLLFHSQRVTPATLTSSGGTSNPTASPVSLQPPSGLRLIPMNFDPNGVRHASQDFRHSVQGRPDTLRDLFDRHRPPEEGGDDAMAEILLGWVRFLRPRDLFQLGPHRKIIHKSSKPIQLRPKLQAFIGIRRSTLDPSF